MKWQKTPTYRFYEQDGHTFYYYPGGNQIVVIKPDGAIHNFEGKKSLPGINYQVQKYLRGPKKKYTFSSTKLAKCEKCGKEFNFKTRKPKLCPDCAPRYIRPTEKFCKVCGIPIPINKQYCGKCKTEGLAEYQQQYYVKHRGGGSFKTPDFCVTCGKPLGKDKKKRSKKYCSEECKPKIEKELAPKVKKICIVCGKEFTGYEHKGVFCSKACRAEDIGVRNMINKNKKIGKFYSHCEACGKETNSYYKHCDDCKFKTHTRECIFCGTEFVPVKKQIICKSPECKKKLDIKHTRDSELRKKLKKKAGN